MNWIILWNSLLFETNCHRSHPQEGLQRISGAVWCLPLQRAEADAAEEFGVCPVFLSPVSSLRQCSCGCNGSSHSRCPQRTKDYLKPFPLELLHFTTELYLVFKFTLCLLLEAVCI